MNTAAKIYIIRHGETQLNAEGRLQGHIDMPLNENGRKLAQITGEALKEVPFDYILSSPLSRAVETARLVTAPSSRTFQKTIPLIRDSRLMEISWGQWDQLICTEDNFEIPSNDFNKFYSDPFHFQAAPDGESITDVCRRVGSFWEDFLENSLFKDKTVLISAHGCSVRALLYHIEKNNNNFWRNGVPKNCSLSLVEIKNGQPVICFEDHIYYDPSLCVNLYQSVQK